VARGQAPHLDDLHATLSLMPSGKLTAIVSFLSLTLFLPSAPAQNTAGSTEPFPPHRVIGNVYYVGSKGLASYLITTPQGHILINSSMDANVPPIRDSIEKLGFRFTGSKITAAVLGWVEDSVIRSDNPDVGVAESFSRCVDTWIVW
jgi:hypothetical protein